METLLIAVTIVSLGVALVMSRVAWRASRAEKQRAAARVAALAAAAGIPAIDEAADLAPPQPAAWRASARSTDEAVDHFATQLPSAAVAEAAETAAPGAVPVQSSFLGAEAPIRESQQHQRWLRAAAAVLALVLGSVVYVRMSHHGATPATAQAQSAPAPLELISLRHEREGVNLSIAGLVRNPATGGVVERVTAVVYLFDQQGAFVTSAKAPIDFLKLTAGDESPFVVKVAAPPSVARYRVSFRTDEGTLAHVDRRGEPPVAAPAALARQ